ncbi:uncharacterized protein LOC135435448 isoform X2 [Drosophila montana]|uniref:uncharacterized protein LOC135435448 isoform X2 n=1 Tax=Drosophila montana TaxID=40370 RepID=UPI00313C82E8
MNRNEPQVSETGRGVSGRPEGDEASEQWPEASSNPAIRQRACVSCCKNCVVHRLDVETGLRPGSDPQRAADQWDRTDSEPQHQDNSWDRNYREPQQANTYEPKNTKLLANTIDHDYFERPSRRSSTVQNYAQPQGQAHYPPPPPQPQPPTDAGFGTRPAETQSEDPPISSQQRPTILVIVVNYLMHSQFSHKNSAGAPLNNGCNPVAYQADYRDPPIYPDRNSINEMNLNRAYGPAENQYYPNVYATYPNQEQRVQIGPYDAPARFNDDDCCCSRPYGRAQTGYEQQVPNGTMGQGNRCSFGQQARNGTMDQGHRCSFGQQVRNGLRDGSRRDTYEVERDARQRHKAYASQALQCRDRCPINNQRSNSFYNDIGSGRGTGTTIGQGERSFEFSGGREASFTSIADQSVADPSVNDQSVIDPSVTDRSTTERSTTERSLTERSLTERSLTDQSGSGECVCDSRCDCDCECELRDLENTLESLVPNEECLCYLDQMERDKRAKVKKKKQRKPKVIYDRFATPPFVIEPKTFCLGCLGCNRSCCHPCCGRCCTSCYPWCQSR